MRLNTRSITALLILLLMPAISVIAQQATVERTSYTPPIVTISSDTTIIRNCGPGAQPTVHLTARTSQGKNPVRYAWTTEAGRIEGNGPSATWSLDGVAPGFYHATLETFSGIANENCQVFASTLVLVECPPAPVCPQLQIVCPTNIELGQPVVFDSLVSGSVGASPLVYNWVVSGGSIIEGQGTSSIKVNASGLEGQSLIATASLAGYDASSRCSASCSTQIPVALTCRKFDEYPEISRNDEKARLDNLGVALQNDPFATAYVIIHPAEHGKSGDIEKRSRNITDYLISSRGLDGKRIVVQVGSPRPEAVVEIWLCPRGTTPH